MERSATGPCYAAGVKLRRPAPSLLLLIAVLVAMLLAFAVGGDGAVAVATELPLSTVALAELGEKARICATLLPSRELPAHSFQRRGPPRGAFTVEPSPRTTHWKEKWQGTTDSPTCCSS